MDRLNELPAVREGHLAITHSLDSNSKKTTNDVRYLLYSPHDHHNTNGDDPYGIKQIPSKILARLDIEESLLRDYLESERDKGINPLCRAILERIPGGLLVNAQTNRGVVNANRNPGAEALAPIWTPEAFAAVEAPLLAIHNSQMAAYRKIVNALHTGAPILHMHSMDISGPKPGTRPPLSRENFRTYVEAQGLAPHQRLPRVQDLITGKTGGPYLANRLMNETLQTLFDEHGIAWKLNGTYDTHEGYPDYDDMLTYPGRVTAPDITKDQLCRALGSTFDSRTAQVDPERVAFMADLFARALVTCYF